MTQLASTTSLQYGTLTDHLLNALRSLVDTDRFSISNADLELHAQDQSFHPPTPPQVILWPETTEEVSLIIKLANEARIPVTAWGVGTSLEGNPMAVRGGIMLDFSRMTQIVEIRPEDFQVDVQPGVTRVELNKALSRYGLFFAPDPGANATIGGMIGNNASGIKTIKYGATKDNVMKMTVVKADGDVINVGTLARKDSSGYDLLHLFIGSEGTLGIVTQATLKLFPLPANFSAVLASFETVAEAMQAVVDIVGSGLEPSALEFVDSETVVALNKDKGLGLQEKPLIIMEFNGTSDDQGLKDALDICKANGAVHFEAAAGLEERNRLWQARHHTYETLRRVHPDYSQLIMDVAVPISKYPDLVLYAESTLREHNLVGYKFGHAGDGNLHINILYKPEDAEGIARMQHANGLIVEHGIELGGTATGEHGIGIGKRKYMAKQHGASVETMRQIKQVLDPHGILNPGKVFLD